MEQPTDKQMREAMAELLKLTGQVIGAQGKTVTEILQGKDAHHKQCLKDEKRNGRIGGFLVGFAVGMILATVLFLLYPY